MLDFMFIINIDELQQMNVNIVKNCLLAYEMHVRVKSFKAISLLHASRYNNVFPFSFAEAEDILEKWLRSTRFC